MRTPIYVRPFVDGERATLEAGLRSSDAFVLRRCQIILSSAAGKRAARIAREVHCDADTVLNVIHAFNAVGLAALTKGSNRPLNPRSAFEAQGLEGLTALLQQSPRSFGQESSVWTLELIADVSFEQKLTSRRVTGEAIRLALQRLGVGWKRAKHWISSPDPEYARKKAPGTAC
jgi:transposase